MGNDRLTPKRIWKEDLMKIRPILALTISLTVLVDILIFIGMLMKIDWIFYMFAYVCSLSPVGVIVILIKEIIHKKAI